MAFELMLYPGHLWITDSQVVLRRIAAKAQMRGLKSPISTWPMST
jgi:hypothetical protein